MAKIIFGKELLTEHSRSCPSCARVDDTQGLARVIGIGLLKFTGIMSLSGGEWEKSIAKDVQRFIRGKE